MGDEGKKISFGFSKLTKKTSIVQSKLNQIKPEENKIEFIACLEGKSIKLKDPIQPEQTELVIPLLNTSNINTIHSSNNVTDEQLSHHTIHSKNEPSKDAYRNNLLNENNILPGTQNENLTLDQKAEKEILDEVSKKLLPEETRILQVPLTSSAPLGEKESTIDDYDSVPVNQFGLAMLRGMGWAPGKGIGKNEKLVTACLPPVRPKGMGLGADKHVKPQIVNSATGEELKMIKGGYIRVIAGTHKDNYGQIEGFDDESGRVIVKLVLQNVTVSLNEFMIQLVDKTDFTKNSKVINVGKYEQYKHKQEKDQGVEGKAIKPSEFNAKVKKYKHQNSDTSDGERSEQNQRKQCSPLRKSRDKYSRSVSSSSSSEGREKYSKYKIKSSSFRDHKNSLKTKRTIKKSKYRDSSSSSSSSNISRYNHSSKQSDKKVKGSKSNYRRVSRSRSRSPRKHSSHSKHKKSRKHR